MSHVDKLEYVSIEEATKPRDGEVLCNRWWVVHPEKGLAFFRMNPRARHRAAQCNHDRAIVEHFCTTMYPGHQPQLIEAVFTGPAPQGDQW